MAKLSIWLVFLIIAVATAEQELHHTRDRNFILRQEFVYQLFYKPDDLSKNFADIVRRAKNFDIVGLRGLPVNQNAVSRYIHRYYGPGLLPRGRSATAFNPVHLAEIKELFDILYSARDFRTFALVSLWSANQSNRILWFFAEAVAVLRRRDTRLLRLPRMHEALPQYFYNRDVLSRLDDISCSNGNNVVNAGYSESISRPEGAIDDPEVRITYFTEDVGLSNYYFFLVLDLPFFLGSSYYHLPRGIRGERYFDDHRQFLARYHLERLSNGLPEVEDLNFNDVVTGLYPDMEDYNGNAFPGRPSNARVQVEKRKYVQWAENVEKRILTAADTGELLANDSEAFSSSFNEFMNAVQGNADSVNLGYYGDYEILARHVLGYAPEPRDSFHVIIGALENYNAGLRDPAFYRMFKKILGFGWRYKARLAPYARKDLEFPGVRIDSVDVGRIVTYFERFDSILGNQQCRNVSIVVRQERLNHGDFSVNLKVNSLTATKAVVRIFLGPKYDSSGQMISLDRSRYGFFQLDQFLVNLKQGSNRISRKDADFAFQVAEAIPSEVFYNLMEQAVDNETTFGYYERPYGYPRHLIVPKGKRDGLRLRLLVVVNSVEKIREVDTLINGRELDDGRPLGFPVDRCIDDDATKVDNLFIKDVTVYHG